MFELEFNIPIPMRNSEGEEFPFSKMKPSHSFFVPDGYVLKRGCVATSFDLRAAMYNAEKKLNLEQGSFKLRTVKGGYRIWRIA